MDEDLKIYKELYDSSFGIRFNMNDTFGWATADEEDISTDNLDVLMPLLRIYGVDEVLDAYVSVKRGYEVMDELKKLETFNLDSYNSAMKTIKRWSKEGKIDFTNDGGGFIK